ncbi:hypothetical protein DBV15_06617 [Temnothorax longispinosus]|uniref:Uncharacterized protein n=1 Tax=Temnothorax longispinosus TaxID=300112 RepID=A0A4S2KKC0_9HYME|nr:hypothetical protein DBV15_06617 [Temnothorax longispinosus]
MISLMVRNYLNKLLNILQRQKRRHSLNIRRIHQRDMMSGSDSTSIRPPSYLVSSSPLPKVCPRLIKVTERRIRVGGGTTAVRCRLSPPRGLYKGRMVPSHAIHHQAPPVTMLMRRSIFFLVDFSLAGRGVSSIGRSADRRCVLRGLKRRAA